jgi:putative ABC transport system permease protein
MTRRQVMRLVLNESVIVGGLGVGLGLIAGPLLGRATIILMKTLIGESVFVFAPSQPSLTSVATAVTLGLSVTIISVIIPAWQATRITPQEALRQDSSSGIKPDPGRRTWAGVMIIIIWSYLAVAPPGEWVASPWDVRLAVIIMLVWLVCLASVTPALIGGFGKWLRRWSPSFMGAQGRFFADNFRRDRGRVTLTILTLAVSLTMVVGITGFMEFSFNALMRVKLEQSVKYGAWTLTPYDIAEVCRRTTISSH